jgi:hypothetical protein
MIEEPFTRYHRHRFPAEIIAMPCGFIIGFR